MRALSFALLAAFVSGLCAEPVKYDYLETAINRFENDRLSDDHGFSARASHLFGRDLYLHGDYTRAKTDVAGADFSMSILNLGIGRRVPVSDLTDLTGELAWIRSRDTFPGRGTENGLSAAAGFRSRVSDRFELAAQAGYAVDGPAGNGYLLRAHGLLHLAVNWGLILSANSYAGDVNVYNAGLRFTF